MRIIKKFLFLLIISYIFLLQPIVADSYEYNTYNNHGVVGLINMPTARVFDSSVHGMTLYIGDPVQKVTIISSPFDWLEASSLYCS